MQVTFVNPPYPTGAHRSLGLRPTYVIRAFSKGGVYGYSTTRTALAWLRRIIAAKLGLG